MTRDELILQAKALVLCGLPYKRIKANQITRRARVGKDSVLSVTFTAIGDGSVLPFGADRAVLGWIQTRAFQTGYVAYNTLTEFFRDFQLSPNGRNYRRHYRMSFSVM